MISRIVILGRLLLTILLGYAGSFLIFQTNFWMMGMWSWLFCTMSAISLIRYVERSKKELHVFLESIKQGDFSQSGFSGKTKDNFNHLYQNIAELFQDLNNKHASEHLLLQAVM